MNTRFWTWSGRLLTAVGAVVTVTAGIALAVPEPGAAPEPPWETPSTPNPAGP